MALGEKAGESGVKLSVGKRERGNKLSLNSTINLINLSGHLVVDPLHTLTVLTYSNTHGFKIAWIVIVSFLLKINRMMRYEFFFTVFLNVEFRNSKEKKRRRDK